ncbi:MauE/DoxX family redox-associated membrane protein [Blastococcus sp. Marseille-P5729]|uniref:MauE/DoxX family redox-associated membrane protein n=1 Tax=Blastococcus sp. Marseille-P5729 TaxID=2086582 RepID=UPI000D10D32A|nr:MauE/DoxX family redox-associated membrane protein [Blastococcus sp. Marseille-P5729]
MLVPLAAVALVLSAAVLMVSGIAKLREPVATRDAFSSLRLPRLLTRGPWPDVLPWAEIGLGAALLIVPARAVVVPAALAAGLLVAYWVIIARALGFDEPVRCSCFGRIGDHEVSRRTLLRNTVLVVTGAVGLVGALRGADVWWLLSERRWGWLAVVVLTAAVTLLAFDGSPSVGDAAAVEDDDHVRSRIPDAVLIAPDREPTTLRELAAFRPVLLIGVDCTCGSTVQAINRLSAWAERIPEVDLRMLTTFQQPTLPGLEDAVYDHEAIAWRALGMTASPCAVLLGADGMLAGGPVSGVEEIGDMVEDIGRRAGPVPHR